MKHYRQSHTKGEKENIRATTLCYCRCYPAAVSQFLPRWSCTHSSSRCIWMTVSHNIQQNPYSYLLIQHVHYVSIHLLPCTQPLFLLSLCRSHVFCFVLFFLAVAAASHSQTGALFHIHTRTCFACVCEPLLRRQAWVERPLGSGSRYCRAVRWSILDHCISTEQSGVRREVVVVELQAFGPSAFVNCWGTKPRHLSADSSALLIFFVWFTYIYLWWKL